jgi:type IV fimbrial biogenesis protein FimT
MRGALQQGFTLIELLITIAIIGIVSMVAIPSFSQAMLSSKLGSIANTFVSSAQLARSEAIKRNRTVMLCASSDGSSCSGGWHQGWIVRANDGTLISRQPALPTGFQLTGNVTTIEFPATGVGATCAILTLKKTSDGSQQRILSVSTTGRPKAEKTSTFACGA